MAHLDFYNPPEQEYFCWKLGYEALSIGKSMPCFLSMANEEIVKYYLLGKIPFLSISKTLKKWMSCHKPFDIVNWESILEVQKEVKHLTRE